MNTNPIPLFTLQFDKKQTFHSTNHLTTAQLKNLFQSKTINKNVPKLQPHFHSMTNAQKRLLICDSKPRQDSGSVLRATWTTGSYWINTSIVDASGQL